MPHSPGTLSLLLIAALLQDKPTESEEKIRLRLDNLVKSVVAKDGEGVTRCFHARRMIKELEARGFGGPAATPEEEERKIRGLEAALPKIASGSAAMGAPWEKIRTLSVQLKPGGTEAEALTNLTVGGSKTKVRFWLIREDEEWRIYDFEMREANVRLSVTMGVVWASMKGGRKEAAAVMKSFMALQKAVALMGSGELEEAQKVLKAALEAQPPPMLAAWGELVNAGLCSLLGEHEDAVKAAERALVLQKDLHVALHAKAEALFELEEFEKCVATEQEYLKRVGDDAEGWLLLGNAHDKLKQPEEAIQAYRKGAAADDEEFANRLQLGRLLIAAKKTAEARPVLKEASRNAAPEESAYEEASQLLEDAGDFAGVLELAKERLTRTPDEVVVLLHQGRALRKLKRFDEAEKAIRPAVEANKEEHSLVEELIFILALGGKEVEALKRTDQLAAEDPDRAHYLRAYVHVTNGKSGKALEELRAFLDEDSDGADEIEKEPVFEKLRQEVDLQVLLSKSRAHKEFLAEALKLVGKEDWEGLLKLAKDRAGAAPDNEHPQFYQGLALRRLGRPFDAELAFKAATEKSKVKTRYCSEIGRALAAQGKLDEALAVADELANAEKPRAMELRIAIYAMVNKPELAIKAMEEFFKTFPESELYFDNDKDLQDFVKLKAVQKLLKKAKSDE